MFPDRKWIYLIASGIMAQIGGAAQSAQVTERIAATMQGSLQRQQASVLLQLRSRQKQVHVATPLIASRRDLSTSFAQRPVSHAECRAPAPVELARQIEAAAQANALSSNLLHAVAHVESGFMPCAVSSKGAQGLMQIMPATGLELGLVNPWDSQQSLEAGAKYLRQLLDRYKGDVRLALSAYNAGPGTVDRYKTVPPIEETRDYVRRIMSEISSEIPTPANTSLNIF